MSFSSQLFSTGILADVYRVHATDIDLDCDQDIVVSVTGANAVVLYENTDPEVRGSLTFTAVSSGAPGVRGVSANAFETSEGEREEGVGDRECASE